MLDGDGGRGKGEVEMVIKRVMVKRFKWGLCLVMQWKCNASIKPKQ